MYRLCIGFNDSNNSYVCTAVPDLRSCLAIPAKGEDIGAFLKVRRHFHFVHQRPGERRLAWFRHILACPMKSGGSWRELPAFRARGVDPAHVSRVADRDRVHGPLRAEWERPLSRSVGAELDSRGGVPAKLHPAVFRCKVKRSLLETFFIDSCRSIFPNLAKPVAVAATMVRQNTPTNLRL